MLQISRKSAPAYIWRNVLYSLPSLIHNAGKSSVIFEHVILYKTVIKFLQRGIKFYSVILLSQNNALSDICRYCTMKGAYVIVSRAPLIEFHNI